MRTLARHLGLTVRGVSLLALAVAALVVGALASVPELYGAACVLTFLAGTVWDQAIYCDDCGQSLQGPELAERG